MIGPVRTVERSWTRPLRQRPAASSAPRRNQPAGDPAEGDRVHRRRRPFGPGGGRPRDFVRVPFGHSGGPIQWRTSESGWPLRCC